MIRNDLCALFFNLKKYAFFYLENYLFCDFSDINDETILSKEIERNKSVVIYGFGPYGEEYFVRFFSKYKILGIYDKNFELMSPNILNPETIHFSSFDYVIVTVMNSKARNSVINFLISKGISEENIIFVERV